MNVFDYPGMKDGLTPADIGALKAFAQCVAKSGAIFVEIGSWKGHSTCALAQVARTCNGKVYAIDHWQGSPGVIHHTLETNCFEVFRKNIHEMKLDDYVFPLVMSSLEASRIFADNIADLVFIDADHRYESIKQDIQLWMPKVNQDGMLCGHDSEFYYTKCPDWVQKKIEDNTNKDYLSKEKLHPGIVKALYESFKDKHSLYQDKMWQITREEYERI